MVAAMPLLSVFVPLANNCNTLKLAGIIGHTVPCFCSRCDGKEVAVSTARHHESCYLQQEAGNVSGPDSASDDPARSSDSDDPASDSEPDEAASEPEEPIDSGYWSDDESVNDDDAQEGAPDPYVEAKTFANSMLSHIAENKINQTGCNGVLKTFRQTLGKFLPDLVLGLIPNDWRGLKKLAGNDKPPVHFYRHFCPKDHHMFHAFDEDDTLSQV